MLEAASATELWQQFFTEVADGLWDCVFLSPPCNTFSRARHLWKKSPGPRPIRSKRYPYGFPWVSNVSKQTLGQHNVDSKRSFANTCASQPITSDWNLKRNGLVDGLGLRSPNRWWPSDRFVYQKGAPAQLAADLHTLNLVKTFVIESIPDLRRAAFELGRQRLHLLRRRL